MKPSTQNTSRKKIIKEKVASVHNFLGVDTRIRNGARNCFIAAFLLSPIQNPLTALLALTLYIISFTYLFRKKYWDARRWYKSIYYYVDNNNKKSFKFLRKLSLIEQNTEAYRNMIALLNGDIIMADNEFKERFEEKEDNYTSQASESPVYEVNYTEASSENTVYNNVVIQQNVTFNMSSEENVNVVNNNNTTNNNVENVNYYEDIKEKKEETKYYKINYTDKIYNEFIVVDTETTGLDSVEDRIIELCALKYKDGEVIDTFETLIDPEIVIQPHITKINNITNEMVKGKPVIEEVMPKFLEFIGDMPLAAHNAKFDVKFINANLVYLDKRITNEVIDTLSISRKIYKDLPNHKLVTIKESLDLNLESHRANADCIVAAQIYLDYCNKNYGLEAEALDVDDSVKMNQYAMELEKAGKIEEAVKKYKEAIELGFKGTYPFDRLNVYYRKNKDYDNEIETCNKAIKLYEGLTTSDARDKLLTYKERLVRAMELKQKQREREIKVEEKLKKLRMDEEKFKNMINEDESKPSTI